MHLYHFGESSASYRVRIALALKGLNAAYHFVDIRNGEYHHEAYRRINPQGLVPCFVAESGERYGQSIAIIEYLEETYPDPAILPVTYEDRASARSIEQQISSDVGPFQKMTLQFYLRDEFGLSDAQRKEWLHFWLRRGLEPIEKFVSDRLGGAGLLFGDTATIAECCIIPQLYNLRRFDFEISQFPALASLEERCLALPAFQVAHPSRWRGEATR